MSNRGKTIFKLKGGANVEIEQCIPLILFTLGLKKTRDYTLSKGQLYLNRTDLKNKVTNALRDFYPDKYYYWETPHLLQWF